MPTVAITGQTTFGANTSGTTTQLDNNFLLCLNALNSFNQYSNYLVDSGVANAYVITAPASTTLTLAAGLELQFKASAVNTGASTLNANGTGVKNILNLDGSALLAGQIPVNSVVSVIYDGTQYILLSPFFSGSAPKVVNATRDISLTTNWSVTGVGFKPRAYDVQYGINGSSVFGVGKSDGTTSFAVSNDYVDAAGTFAVRTTGVIMAIPSAGAFNLFSHSSFDVDGITMTAAKTGAPVGTLSASFTFYR